MDYKIDPSNFPVDPSFVKGKGLYVGPPLTINGFRCVRVVVNNTMLDQLIYDLRDKLKFIKEDSVIRICMVYPGNYPNGYIYCASYPLNIAIKECVDDDTSYSAVDICPDGLFLYRRYWCDKNQYQPRDNLSMSEALDIFNSRYDELLSSRTQKSNDNKTKELKAEAAAKPVCKFAKISPLLVYAQIKGPRATVRPKYL